MNSKTLCTMNFLTRTPKRYGSDFSLNTLECKVFNVPLVPVIHIAIVTRAAYDIMKFCFICDQNKL